MIRTIITDGRAHVQGEYLRDMPDGKIAVRVGKRVYTGWPVNGKDG